MFNYNYFVVILLINIILLQKLSKPWSVVISSKGNELEKLQQLPIHEENVSKFSKLETDLKTYETLVSELNKLSAEEQNIRNKLFPDNLKVCLNLLYIIQIMFYYKLIHV